MWAAWWCAGAWALEKLRAFSEISASFCIIKKEVTIQSRSQGIFLQFRHILATAPRSGTNSKNLTCNLSRAEWLVYSDDDSMSPVNSSQFRRQNTDSNHGWFGLCLLTALRARTFLFYVIDLKVSFITWDWSWSRMMLVVDGIILLHFPLSECVAQPWGSWKVYRSTDFRVREVPNTANSLKWKRKSWEILRSSAY